MGNMETAKEEIKKLIEKYNKVVESGKLRFYNEEMTKKDFILPLFRALGWNVEDGEEVIAEEKISKGRVDYAFKIDGIPKLFLEAKALKVDLNKIEYIEQAINYAWHKGSTWAVLTNFEDTKVFNAEWKTANPLQNMLFSLSYSQLSDNFDQLWLLSRESLKYGLIDKEAERWGKKAKKIPIDKQLLNDLTRFRELLTKNILKNNPSKKLSGDELDESVQRILDRLIFIRTLEDKQLEAPVLQSIIREERHKKIYKKLNQLFRKMDNIYNSKLFSPHLCEELDIDDNILEKVIRGLFKTSDNTVNYDFSAIDADVLGNMYEQYLGHILKKTEKRAKLTSGKAYRKEQGIYYTPTYIVDYIVKNTVGELAKNKKFDLDNIKILDPACGSGSFLMKAFDYLIALNKKKKGNVNQTKLDFSETSVIYDKKVDILKNNIFGVDLDPKAVEIAQLNLLLKTAEKKHRLPTLQENIKVGNSLIDDSAIAGERAFKWEEQFKEVMDNGGFDVVIGNPPYVGYREIYGTEFIKKKFYSAQVKDKYNLLVLFIEQGLKILKYGGFLGFIVSNQFLCSDFGKNLRKFILENARIKQIIDVSMMKVFKDASTYPIIIILEKAKPKKNTIKIAKPKDETELMSNSLKFEDISQEIYNNFDKNLFLLELNDKNLNIIEKMKENSKPLKGCVQQITWGTSATGYGKKKIKLDKFLSLSKKEQEKYVKIIQTSDIQRYRIDWQKEFIPKNIYTENKLRLFEYDKIVVGRLNKFLKATIDTEKYALGKATLIIPKEEVNIKFLLALLNSKLIDYYFKILFKSTHMGQGYIRYDVPYLGQLPIKKVSEYQQQIMIKLVDNMLYLNKCLNEIKEKQTDEKTRLEKEIQKIDDKIDQLVYKLYGLTKEEIKIVEEFDEK